MMVNAVEEKSLVRQGHTREEQIAALFDEHYPSLRGLAFVMLGDRSLAEELVMEAFVKAFTGWDRFRTLEHPHAYLRQVVVNLCRSRFRRQKIEFRVNELMHAGDRDATESGTDLRLDVWDAVRRLPERQRACVVLRYAEDLPEAEIAEILQCSVGTVKSQLFKAKSKMEQELRTTHGGGAGE